MTFFYPLFAGDSVPFLHSHDMIDDLLRRRHLDNVRPFDEYFDQTGHNQLWPPPGFGGMVGLGLSCYFSFSLSYFYFAKDFDRPGFFFFHFTSTELAGLHRTSQIWGGHLSRIRVGSPRGNPGFGPLAKDDGLRRLGQLYVGRHPHREAARHTRHPPVCWRREHAFFCILLGALCRISEGAGVVGRIFYSCWGCLASRAPAREARKWGPGGGPWFRCPQHRGRFYE
ncbi:uncharacterized protein B0H64DRAFT_235851 [Chaetomium fimeti]|jgi:hypothetical protein|uniref:Uncharacterized protein n=1 Tax=Chaetomium fimeti TaxID=1854472 RepID=A0AAE0LQ14_9PEZI|nr:hypothetical protein B0H64DRAFT_235851 [Chaetomium fimeti]